MSETLPPFIKWGSFKSNDPNKPDILEMQVVDTEPFETAYSLNVKALKKEDKAWNEVILPLKSHESSNPSLLKEWEKWTRKKAVKQGKNFVLKTWLSTSKNGRPIRRFVLEF